ncbi:hypothetical protein J7297_01696 [Nakaseomyces glabratus]|nr:hypothetical protein J7297_01696 [Nakaseomyces glabratus]KAH7593158.1 hypothetical protein J7296_01698 [Nakaseomyces glabratus]
METYLPFVDDAAVDQAFEAWVDELVEEECGAMPSEGYHPEVPRVMAAKGRDAESGGIDLARYNDAGDVRLLKIVDSYLRHAEITLRELISKTIVNQWVISNDCQQSASRVMQAGIDKLQGQLDALEKYRRDVQVRYRRTHPDTADASCMRLRDMYI